MVDNNVQTLDMAIQCSSPSKSVSRGQLVHLPALPMPLQTWSGVRNGIMRSRVPFTAGSLAKAMISITGAALNQRHAFPPRKNRRFLLWKSVPAEAVMVTDRVRFHCPRTKYGPYIITGQITNSVFRSEGISRGAVTVQQARQVNTFY